MNTDIRVILTGHFSLFSEWMLEVNDQEAWFVRLYTVDSPRKSRKKGEYWVEIFTDARTAAPLRLMTQIEQSLFELALEHKLVTPKKVDDVAR